jgi:predicted Ser/Thr protein kinase
MIVRREPDDDESADDAPDADRCSQLDEYWDALAKDEAAAARQRFIEQDQPGESIAMDLDVLDKLQRARCLRLEEGETAGPATAWLAGFLTKDGHPRPGGSVAVTELSGTAGGAAANQPQRIGKYIVVEMFESGGQAQVFRVIHPGMATELALKLARRPMATEEQGGQDPLLSEGRLLVDCKHPNLVQIVDVDVHEGRRFVVMEYVKGLTLQQFVARHRPGPRKAARLVIELAGAVAYLHDRGIVHQDIKPQNVLIDDRGRPRLIDLGLARRNHAWCDDTNEWIGGTAGYMSPEQATGSAYLISPRTDVFGLGGLLYHLLTGRALYFGASFASLFKLAREAGYVPVRELNPRALRSLARICQKALARDPERRYPTADALGRDLKRALQRRWMAAMALGALVAFTAAGLFVERASPRAAYPNTAIVPLVGAPRAETPSPPVAP